MSYGGAADVVKQSGRLIGGNADAAVDAAGTDADADTAYTAADADTADAGAEGVIGAAAVSGAAIDIGRRGQEGHGRFSGGQNG